jgi:hypothetical protein
LPNDRFLPSRQKSAPAPILPHQHSFASSICTRHLACNMHAYAPRPCPPAPRHRPQAYRFTPSPARLLTRCTISLPFMNHWGSSTRQPSDQPRHPPVVYSRGVHLGQPVPRPRHLHGRTHRRILRRPALRAPAPPVRQLACSCRPSCFPRSTPRVPHTHAFESVRHRPPAPLRRFGCGFGKNCCTTAFSFVPPRSNVAIATSFLTWATFLYS